MSPPLDLMTMRGGLGDLPGAHASLVFFMPLVDSLALNFLLFFLLANEIFCQSSLGSSFSFNGASLSGMDKVLEFAILAWD